MKTISFALAGVCVIASGCSTLTSGFVEPAGPISAAQRDLLFRAFLIMMIVAIPVFVMAFAFAWRFRSGGTKAPYRPEADTAPIVDAIIWLVPVAIVVALAVILWRETHRLDPYAPIASDSEPFVVETIAADWKWVFVYPEQNVATVNELAFPASRPLSLRITSDTVMNSIMVPALAGQIYAMAGMETRLNLEADAPGEFTGRNTMFSGTGFSGQHFEARAMSDEDFSEWVAATKGSNHELTQDTYVEIAKPSQNVPVIRFSDVVPGLFDSILAKYRN